MGSARDVSHGTMSDDDMRTIKILIPVTLTGNNKVTVTRASNLINIVTVYTQVYQITRMLVTRCIESLHRFNKKYIKKIRNYHMLGE